MKKIVLITVIIGAMAFGGGFFAYKFVFADQLSGAQAEEAVVEDLALEAIVIPEQTYTLEGRNQFAIATFYITATSEKAKKNLEKQMIAVQDVIVATLISKNPSEIKEGGETFKTLMKDKINGLFDEAYVEEFYVTNLRIQG